jgi:FxsC-like protein
MPDYSFFLSYASADRIRVDRESETTNKRDLVRIFFDDLDIAMKGLGYPEGGFFDKKRLEAKWKEELELGLASSRVLVPLYSPNYFQSSYCGREWETFNIRFAENQAHRYPDVTNPKVILPVLWKAPVTRPQEVGQYQIDYEDYPAEYTKYGLEYLVSLRRNSVAYRKFVVDFSQKLKALADAQGAPKVRELQEFERLNPPFPGGYHRPGLKFVQYVCVTGMRHQMQNVRRAFDSYAIYTDRRDWRPCFPDLDRAAEAIATGPARDDNRAYAFLPPSPELMMRLREARRLNNVIVVMVDPWSMRIPEWHQFARDFDAEEFPNSAVLVNWNERDPETSANAEQLRELLRDHFRARRSRGEYYKDPVTSPETIEQAVLEAFGAVQARLIELGKIQRAGGGDAGHLPLITN